MSAKLRTFIALISVVPTALLIAVPAVALPEIVATIPTGNQPAGIAIDHSTNRIFLAETYDSDIRVIDGQTNGTITTFGQGLLGWPREIAIDETRRIVWITTVASNVFAYNIDTYQHITNFPAGDRPIPVAVDAARGRAYVGDWAGGTVKVIDEATKSIVTSITVGTKPLSIAVNGTTGRVYVANVQDDSVSVIDAASLSVVKTVTVKTPYAVAVDETTNRYYVANEWESTLVTFDGSTDQQIAAPLLGTSKDQACCVNHVAVDPVLHRAYVPGANIYVAMVNTQTNGYMAQLPTSGVGPSNIAINANTSLIYVSDPQADIVTVIHEDLHPDQIPPVSSAYLTGGQTIGGKTWAWFQVSLTLACTDEEGCLRSEYRLDGGIIRTSYGETNFPSEGLHTLEFRSIDTSGNTEDWQALQFGIDRTPPATDAAASASYPAAGAWTRGTWDIVFSCSDKKAGFPLGAVGCASTSYQVDGGSWQTYSGNTTVTAEGDHLIIYRSVDKLGNLEPTKALRLGIDRTLPITAFAKEANPPTQSAWSMRAWTVTLSCTDPLGGSPKGNSGCSSMSSTADGVTTTYTEPFDIQGEGRHTLSYFATDNAGNMGKSSTQALLIDATAPQASMVTPDGSLFIAQVAPVQLVASADDPKLTDGTDGSGVASLCFETYELMPAGGSNYVGCFDATQQAGQWRASPTLPAGRYETRPRPRDVAGNRGSGSPITFTTIGLSG